MSKFEFDPSEYIPYRDKEVMDRVRNIKREDFDKHPNPDFKIIILPDEETMAWQAMMDYFYTIKEGADNNRDTVLIMGQPDPAYKHLAWAINKFRINCKKLHTFNMDEYADQDGNTAPEDWRKGFLYSALNNFWSQIDEDLRPPRNQIHGPQTENIEYYGKMIEDLGNADLCQSGPGWTGHLAFIEPGLPGTEFEGTLEEFKEMGPRIVTLNPFTIAQNSLHASFGYAGDLGSVPPKAATIGPAEVLKAKKRTDWNGIRVAGSDCSWEKFATRLAAHGPVTPLVPTSILQLVRTDFYVSEFIASDIVPRFDITF
jgi:glucosamine-6-phosphate deaminase